MQYNFQKKDDQFEINIQDTLVDFVYELEQFQNIGLLHKAVPLNILKQDEEIKQVFADIIDWIKKNVAEYNYIKMIKDRINYVLKYGISTYTKNNNQIQIRSSVSSKVDTYRLFITKEDNSLSIQTNTTNKNNELTTIIVVNLNPYDEKGNVLHSTIEELTVKKKIYDFKDKTLKNTESAKETRFYRSLSEINHSIRAEINTTQIAKDLQNPKNNDVVLQDSQRILTKYPCQNPSIIACSYKENNYSKENEKVDTNSIYYLARNNGINRLRLDTNNTKCQIGLEQYRYAITGEIESENEKIDVEEAVETFETEHFTHIANLSGYRTISKTKTLKH